MPGPAPPALDQINLAARVADRADDRPYIRYLDILARFDIRRALAEADFDLQIGEVLDDRGDIHHQPIIIAHVSPVSRGVARQLCSCYVLLTMSATVFDSDAPPDERRIIIRRYGGNVEMLELPWGLQPKEPSGRPFTVVRAEDRLFPSHRCLVPASEFRHRSQGKNYNFRLANGDWFYFAGIWRPATRDWPEAYAILTIQANDDIAPYHDRQMAVLRRDERSAWLDMTHPEQEVLRPLPGASFAVSRLRQGHTQAELAI